VVECAGFENRSARKGRGSSNLPLSVSERLPATIVAGVLVGGLSRPTVACGLATGQRAIEFSIS
jgi:hypothetical protein